MRPDIRRESVRPGAVMLVAGPRPEVDAWVTGSVVPLTLAPLGTWTALVAGGPSQASPPYDDGALVFASRPLATKAGPGLGFFEIEGRAVITVHPGGRSRPIRWVVWEPETGLLRPPGLDLAGPSEMVAVAGASAQVRDELVELLHETRVLPGRMLQAVMATLGLPGTRLVLEPQKAPSLKGAVKHVPDPRQVGWFDSAVKDSVRLRQELGSLP